MMQSAIRMSMRHTHRPVAIVNILTYRTIYGNEHMSTHFWCRNKLQFIIVIIKNYDIIHFYIKTNVTKKIVDPAVSVILSAFCVESVGRASVSPPPTPHTHTHTERTPTGKEKA